MLSRISSVCCHHSLLQLLKVKCGLQFLKFFRVFQICCKKEDFRHEFSKNGGMLRVSTVADFRLESQTDKEIQKLFSIDVNQTIAQTQVNVTSEHVTIMLDKVKKNHKRRFGQYLPKMCFNQYSKCNSGC